MKESRVRLNQLLEFVLAGADKLSNLSAVLVHLKGGHGGDLAGLRDVAGGVDVHLDEHHGRGGLSQLLEDGSDHSAGGAPRGREVDDDGLAGVVSKEGVELGLVVDGGGHR